VAVLSAQAVVDSFETALGDRLVSSKIFEQPVAVKKNNYRALWLEVRKEDFRRAVEHIFQIQTYPHLSIISCSDRGENIELIYHFTVNYGEHLNELSLGLRVNLPKTDAKIPTITDLIPGAIFAERETQEMIGVEVVGIPDKRRLFLPDDFPQDTYPWRNDDKGIKPDMLRVLPGRQQINK
jgi:membrane-bound hydrogenase subunit beta